MSKSTQHIRAQKFGKDCAEQSENKHKISGYIAKITIKYQSKFKTTLLITAPHIRPLKLAAKKSECPFLLLSSTFVKYPHKNKQS